MHPEVLLVIQDLPGPASLSSRSDKISVILLINRQNCGLSDEGEYYNVSPVRLQVFNAVMKYLSVKK